MEVAIILLYQLVVLILPFILLVGLLRWFWLLSKPAADADSTSSYRASWGKLTLVAAASCLVLYGWLQGALAGPVHGSNHDYHEDILKLVGLVGLLASLLLTAVWPFRLRLALSFGSGVLLALAVASGLWHVSRYKERQRLLRVHTFLRHDRNNWQLAAGHTTANPTTSISRLRRSAPQPGLT